ncbi:unnamed protein product [Rangifer tarandus platyrhynchus]|uniref:Uncharacterized protein n=2 Tax=Rangifer tarandus platyrhynchus TaxID=3082113 RepID=A0ABN8YSC4_RANTA|nr:unnamed protein product [Rangifer tarandus platyrhynchus]CAI9702045.1 unnamed protein product [Rangifer tarandus platyrhynchus]
MLRAFVRKKDGTQVGLGTGRVWWTEPSPRDIPQAPLPRLWSRPASTGCTLISRSLPILRPASPAVVPVSSRPHVLTQSSCSWFQPGVHVSAFTPLSRVPYSTCLCDVTPPPENSPTAESEPVPCSSCHRSRPGPLGEVPRAPSTKHPRS